MDVGVIELATIYDRVRENPEIPHRTGDRARNEAYREIVYSLLDSIPDEPGWYCWQSSKGKILYVGQSSKKKTFSLRARLREELLEEYVANTWTDGSCSRVGPRAGAGD